MSEESVVEGREEPGVGTARRVGVAVVGAGNWGGRHAHAYHRLPGAELVGVCDRDLPKAEELAGRYGAGAYESVEQLLENPAVEAVSIAVPDHLHTEVAIACASAGKHLLVEKPLALTVEDCDSIIRAAESNGVHLMVDFANRWNAPLLKAKEMISAGRVSSPRLAHIRLNNAIYVPTEMLGWSSDSNVLWWIGSHSIDLARWLVDDEVESVSSVSGAGKLRSMGVDTADFYVTTLRFKGGGIAVIENCWILPNERPGLVDFNVRLIGDAGALTMDTHSHGAIEYVGEGGIERPDLFYDHEAGGVARGAFVEAVSHFVKSVGDGTRPAVSGQDGREVTRIILAALASARKGSPMLLSRRTTEPL